MNKQEPLNSKQKIVIRFLRLGVFENLKKSLLKLHPSEIADVLLEISKDEQKKLLDILFEIKLAAVVLTHLPDEEARKLLNLYEEEKILKMFDRLSPDDAVDFLNLLEEEKKQKILASLPESKRMVFEKLLVFDENSAGGLMTPDVLCFNQEERVEDVIEKIKKLPKPEHYHYIYVVDEFNNLIGVCSFRMLVFAPKGVKLKDIMVMDPVRVTPYTHQEEVAKIVADYDLLSVPVVDENNKLLGIVTVDDVIDVIEEEATEDIYNLANLNVNEKFRTSVFNTVRFRVPWLILILFSGFLISLLILYFLNYSSSLSKIPALFPLISILCLRIGIQSMTAVIRGIELGEITNKMYFRVILKESIDGLLAGLILGVISGALVYLIFKDIKWFEVLFLTFTISAPLINLLSSFTVVILNVFNADLSRGTNIIITLISNLCGFSIFFFLLRIFEFF